MRGSSTIWRALARARAGAGGQPGVTRRGLLRALAAGSAAAALPRAALAAPAGRVAIIGGGIAGLSALHHLRAAGVDAHLYEARDRLGGRMYTHRTPGGTAFEIGAQLVNTDHADMHALARAYGVALIDRKADRHRTLVLAGNREIADPALAEALRPIAAQINRDAARMAADYARVAPQLDALSIAAYLDRHRALLGPSWVRELLEATSRTEYGVEPEEASAIELILNLPTVDGDSAEVLGGADERFVIDGGSSTLVTAMAARHAAHVTTDARLAGIARHREGARLTFRDGTERVAERVILALPAPLTRQLALDMPLPPLWRAFIAEVGLGRNEKVQAAASAAPWRAAIGAGGELWQTQADQGCALGWDGSVHAAGSAPVWTWFLGGDEVAAAGAERGSALARRFGSAAEGAIPGLGAATGPVARTNWHAQPLTQGAYVNFRPGQLTRFARLLAIESDDPAARQVPQAGALYFAGEHLSDAFPGYMNGAAQTGRMAAEAILGTRA